MTTGRGARGEWVPRWGSISTRVPVCATVSGSTLRLIVTSLTMTSISSAMTWLQTSRWAAMATFRFDTRRAINCPRALSFGSACAIRLSVVFASTTGKRCECGHGLGEDVLQPLDPKGEFGGERPGQPAEAGQVLLEVGPDGVDQVPGDLEPLRHEPVADLIVVTLDVDVPRDARAFGREEELPCHQQIDLVDLLFDALDPLEPGRVPPDESGVAYLELASEQLDHAMEQPRKLVLARVDEVLYPRRPRDCLLPRSSRVVGRPRDGPPYVARS